MAGLLASLAEFEREILRERVAKQAPAVRVKPRAPRNDGEDLAEVSV